MIIDIFLPLSLVFIMFTLGLGLTIQDFKNIVLMPKAFTIGIINQLAILPIIAFLIISAITIPGEIAVGIMILACCPGGVTSNMITKLSGGDTALSISYTAIVSIVTVVTLPFIVGSSMTYFMAESVPHINIFSLGMTMFFITAFPVCLGLYINTNHKGITNKFYPFANKVSTILFIVIVIGALASEWNTFINNLSSMGPAIMVLILIMLFIGYNSAKLFSINDKQAITIAIESSIQNATVGITIGNLILPSSSGLSILSLPSGVYGILMYLICLPFVFWFLNKK